MRQSFPCQWAETTFGCGNRAKEINVDHLEVDVCIIGAGFAGLAAAYKLKQAGQSVAVLEARDRVGGKVYTQLLPDGTCINMGGTWLGEGHDRMYALVRELGIETYRQYVQGDNLMILDGKVHRYAGTLPRINPLALIDVGLAMQTLNGMAAQVPLDAPWEAEKAHEWDAQTIGAWIDSRWHARTNTAQKMLRTIFEELFMSDPAEVSLLHALHEVHALRNIEWAVGAVGGAQQDLVVGGTHRIAAGLAARLGDAIHLGTPVRQVSQHDTGVEVTADRAAVRARRVIITMPLILAGRLQYDPPLPPLRAQLLDRAPQGQGIKWHAVYPEPFWRADGLTGQGADMDGPPQGSIDCSPPEGKPGVLAAFAFGRAARQLATESAEERRKVCLDGLVKRFGARAANPVHFLEIDWAAEPWSRGDMFAHYGPGVLTGFGKALRAPCGRIHWAGTETATLWQGSIEGAVRSGERAADEVLQGLAPPPAKAP
jgi:monoamine oxidase